MKLPEPIEWEVVTPERAQELLLMNTKNRNPNLNQLKALVRDMRDGRFKPIGVAIAISDTEVLVNGQTRLMACVESGVDVILPFQYDVPEDHTDCWDTNSNPRSAGDVMTMEGIPYARNIPQTLSYANAYLPDGMFVISRKSMRLTINETFQLREYFGASKVEEWCRFASRTGKFITPSITAGFGLAISMCNWHAITPFKFMKRLVTGVDIGSKSPIFQARQRLIDIKDDTGEKASKDITLDVVAAAWNMCQSEKECPNQTGFTPKTMKKRPSLIGFPSNLKDPLDLIR